MCESFLSFPYLPNDILFHIISLLKRSDCTILYWTCHRLRLLVKNRMSTYSTICQDAAADGNLRVIKWAIQKGCPYDLNYCEYIAAIHGHLNVLQWIATRGYKPIFRTYRMAILNGHLNIIKWIHQKKYTFIKMGIEIAVQQENVEILEWIYGHYNYPLTSDLFYFATFGGSVGVLEWLYCHYCPNNRNDISLCMSAALNNRLDMLKWMRKRDFPWDTGVTLVAAYGGHLELFKWAIMNGCPWDRVMCYHIAIHNNKREIIEYIKYINEEPK